MNVQLEITPAVNDPMPVPFSFCASAGTAKEIPATRASGEEIDEKTLKELAERFTTVSAGSSVAPSSLIPDSRESAAETAWVPWESRIVSPSAAAAMAAATVLKGSASVPALPSSPSGETCHVAAAAVEAAQATTAVMAKSVAQVVFFRRLLRPRLTRNREGWRLRGLEVDVVRRHPPSLCRAV